MSGVEKRGCATTVKACDSCRRRKRRCVWDSGTERCTQCTNLSETCTTTHIRKPRAKPQRGNRVAEYESRVQKLESLLKERSAAQPQVEQQPLERADDAIPARKWVENLRNELESAPRPEVPDFETFLLEDFTDSPSLTQTENLANPSAKAFHDESSISNESASVFSNIDDIEPSSAFQGNTSFLQDANIDPDLLLQETSLIPPPLPTTPVCDGYLPPPELGTALLSEFLVDFNTAYCLYRPHIITNHLRVCYAGLSDGSAISWTSAYVVFGLAHTLRAMSATAVPQDMDMAKYYIHRTYASMNSLLLSSPSLGLIQCLIGAAKLIRSTMCTCTMPYGPLLSTSLRVAQSLAYDAEDEEDELPLSDRDIEQERRVFWLSFICDTYTAISSNTPTTHRREDIIAPKPDENPADDAGAMKAAEGHWKVNFFSLRVKMALLQAEAVEQVLSVKARKLGPQALETAVATVLAHLKSFHSSHELFTLSPDQLHRLLYRSDIVHTIGLETGYFMTVHRLNAFLAFNKDHRVNPFSLEGMIRLSKVREQNSYEEARRLLSLLPIAPRGDVGLYWNEYKAFFAALVTIFAHHLNNPQATTLQQSELLIYQELIGDLATLVRKSDDKDITQARELCISMFSRLETQSRMSGMQQHVKCRNESMLDTPTRLAAASSSC